MFYIWTVTMMQKKFPVNVKQNKIQKQRTFCLVLFSFWLAFVAALMGIWPLLQAIVSLLVYLFCCCLFGNIKLVSPMLARCGGGDPGNIINGWRFLVGLGCSTVSVGIIKSLGLCCFSSGVGGSTSMVIIGGGGINTCTGAAMAGVMLSVGILLFSLLTLWPCKAGVGLLKLAMDVVVVSVGAVLTSESMCKRIFLSFCLCRSTSSLPLKRKKKTAVRQGINNFFSILIRIWL